MKLSAVLFDLDNTLILFKETTFFEKYTKKLYLYFSDIMSVEKFNHNLIKSTQMLIQNDGQQTNAEFFMAFFANGTGVDKDDLWQRFMSFYETEFEQFQPLMTPLSGAREVITSIQKKGLKTVIASNPMFPTIVQLARVRWARLNDLSFELITSIENSNFCKPRLEYYLEICEKIRIQPESCLMVGNDPFNDMIASKTGMKTFLTTDSDELSIELSRELVKNAKIEMPTPDYKGPLKKLITVIDELL